MRTGLRVTDVLISIHALREEGDPGFRLFIAVWLISIHALREEGDYLNSANRVCRIVISIHALREEGDLRLTPRPPRCARYFYPRPPRGGRPAPNSTPSTLRTLFLSTPSARRATCDSSCKRGQTAISIHALREEGDPR